MGTREKAAETDFSGVPLEEEVEEELKESAVISMGTEISPVDLLNIMSLCDQVRARTAALLSHTASHSPSCGLDGTGILANPVWGLQARACPGKAKSCRCLQTACPAVLGQHDVPG